MKKKFSIYFKKPLERFINLESSSSITLAVFTLVAILLANSRLSVNYFQVLQIEFLNLSLQHWINDGLMAIFFFVVGLEIKRELAIGELSTFKKASLPVAAALGGMVMPALIYFYFNQGTSHVNGWAIPMATDIAFALGVLMIFGSRIPLSLKVFLLALAIVDDLGAVLVIALFYTEEIKLLGLTIAIVAFLFVLVSRYFKFKSYFLYTVLGLIAWVGFLYSGVHATIAGVILGLLTPFSFAESKNSLSSYSPIDELIHILHPWVSYIIMPIFALANAGISLSGIQMSEVIESKIAIGVILGLIIGKPIGILLFSYLMTLFGLARLPQDLKWRHIFGVSCLAGIGFTMSIFITDLALPAEKTLYSKIGILIASIISGIVGYVAVYFASRKNQFYITQI